MRPSRRRTSRNSCFLFGAVVADNQSRSSSRGSIHSSPESIIASIDLSRSTTVQVQHPKRLLPHDGVEVSTTSGHSPACALRYIVTRSRLALPHGEGELRRYVQTSSVEKSSIGV